MLPTKTECGPLMEQAIDEGNREAAEELSITSTERKRIDDRIALKRDDTIHRV